MRAIIMCAGQGTRWKGETPKHLVEAEGEVLLHRTVRQLRARGVSDVWIASHDARYDVDGATRFDPHPHPYDVDKFYSARDLWTEPVTCHFYGDVFYTDSAMDEIMAGDPSPFRFYGRRRRSRITGTMHGECFGAAFTDVGHFRACCEKLRAMDERGELRRSGSWELLQLLQGKKPNPYGPQYTGPQWTEVNDWTEDFDTLEDYRGWRVRRALAGGSAIEQRAAEVAIRLGPDPVGVEVGIYRGQMSAALLSLRDDLTLYMVDPWRDESTQPPDGYRVSQDALHLEAHARTRFAVERSIVMRMFSVDAAKEFDDASLDFVFIDANHAYEAVRADIAAWLPKLKPGGLLSGHDYFADRRMWPGVAEAVDEAVAAHSWTLETGRRATWFVRLP